MLQKAVMPARVSQFVVSGGEMLAGYVVRADDVAWARTPAQLTEAHGLSFDGSPYSSASPFIDVVRFPATPFTTFVDAVGGLSRADAEQMGGSFVDHPPFTGTGFVKCVQAVPLWWMEPARVPAGTQLIRVRADGNEALIAVYVHVGIGWQLAPGVSGVQQAPRYTTSPLLGASAEYQGQRVAADLLADNRLIVASSTPREGMVQASTGLWWKEARIADVSGLSAPRVDASWRGLRFRVTQRATDGGVESASLVYIGHDALAAEAGGVARTDAGVYEAVAPWAELESMTAVEVAAPMVA